MGAGQPWDRSEVMEGLADRKKEKINTILDVWTRYNGEEVIWLRFQSADDGGTCLHDLGAFWAQHDACLQYGASTSVLNSGNSRILAVRLSEQKDGSEIYEYASTIAESIRNIDDWTQWKIFDVLKLV